MWEAWKRDDVLPKETKAWLGSSEVVPLERYEDKDPAFRSALGGPTKLGNEQQAHGRS